jgi:plastocyanin
MMRNRWALLLGVAAAMLSLTMLVAACDGGGDEDGSPTEPAETEPVATEPGVTEPAATEPDATEPDGGGATRVEISAENTAFDTDSLTVPAGEEVTFVFSNNDDGIQHSFAIYESQEAAEGDDEAIAATPIESGPVTQELATTLDADEYFFWCDVHLTTMSGTLTAE